MERHQLSGKIVVAAGTIGEVDFAPPSGRKWKVVSITETPQLAVTADNTDYVSRRAYQGSTAITAAVTTVAADGGALTIRTPVNWTLSTTVPSSLECTNSSPFNFRVTHGGAGKAYDAMIQVEFEEVRQ